MCKNCVQSLVKKRIAPLGRTPKKPKEFQYLKGVIYALDYAQNPVIQAALEQFKYRFTSELAEYFGELIHEKLKELWMLSSRKIYLVPIPLHPRRLAYRGFNQAQVIAEQIQAKALPLKITTLPLLERIRNTSQQAKLNRQERQKNLYNAFKLNKKFVQYRPEEKDLYFLIDDVSTTGSTLENAAKALAEQGFGKVYGLVVARALK